MKKILVIGSPGAGKSTFARRIRDITGLPLYYLDMLYHKPDRTTIARDEFDSKLREIFALDEWIIDGNYQRTIETRLSHCDTVFLLDYPVDVCLKGIESRVGRKREEMPWTEEKLDEEFRQSVIDFPTNQLPKVYELIEKYRKYKKVVVFKSRKEAEEYLYALSEKYSR